MFRVTSCEVWDSTWVNSVNPPQEIAMRKISFSTSGFFKVRSLLAFSLCGVGALLARQPYGGSAKRDRADDIRGQNLCDHDRPENRWRRHRWLFVTGGDLLLR